MRMKALLAAAMISAASAASAACPANLPTVATIQDVAPVGWRWNNPDSRLLGGGAYVWDAHVRFPDGTIHVQPFRGRPYLFKDEQADVTSCDEDGIRSVRLRKASN